MPNLVAEARFGAGVVCRAAISPAHMWSGYDDLVTYDPQSDFRDRASGKKTAAGTHLFPVAVSDVPDPLVRDWLGLGRTIDGDDFCRACSQLLQQVGKDRSAAGENRPQRNAGI